MIQSKSLRSKAKFFTKNMNRRFVTLARIKTIPKIISNSNSEVCISKSNPAVSKWKAGLKEGANWFLIAGGITLLGAVGYSLVGELFDPRNQALIQLFDDASYIIKADAQVRKKIGYPIHCSYGPRSTTRNRLISGNEWTGLKKRVVVVQFYVSSPFREGFATVRAVKTKTKTLMIESIDIKDLSDPGQKVFQLDLGIKKKSRFGF